MRSIFTLILGLALVSALSDAPSGARDESGAGARFKTGAGPPPAAAPREIWDAWLRFHEGELCQGLDTIFVFHKNGMEIWCRIEDEKAYQKLTEIVAPLRSSFVIDLYPTRLSVDKKPADAKEPPPSLWNNAELRSYLQDPYARNGGLDDPEVMRPPAFHRGEAELMFKQRLIMFAAQTLDWERKMNRYAGDLPALVQAALNRTIPDELRARAKAVCVTHAQAVDRLDERLTENMMQALPRAAKKASDAPETKPAVSAPEDAACQIADAAQNVSRRIYRFIHPTHYTVQLLDLRQPDLIEALRGLRKLVSIFLHTLSG